MCLVRLRNNQSPSSGEGTPTEFGGHQLEGPGWDGTTEEDDDQNKKSGRLFRQR